MSLYTRLLGIDAPRIPVHLFMSLLGEVERGLISGAQASAALGLSAGEITEATALIAKIVPPDEAISIGGFVQLTNVGNTYDSTSQSKGLGVVQVQTAGITQFQFGVFVNKVGSGTQSWQLWNHTTQAEVAVLDDAGATGDKVLSVTQDVGPLSANLHVVRVRVKSTTAQDDPIFYGASLRIRRVRMMTADVLHQILLAGEAGVAGYATEAELLARIG